MLASLLLFSALAAGGPSALPPGPAAVPEAKAVEAAPSSASQAPVPPKEPASPAAVAPSLPTDPMLLLAVAMDMRRPAEQRVVALERLGAIGDPRVLPSLAYLARDGAAEVRLASVRAISALRTEDSQKALCDNARDGALFYDARVESVKQLHAQGLPFAPDRLEELFRDKELASSLQLLAKAELDTHYPGRLKLLPEPPPPPRPDFSGQLLLTASGTVYGAYTLYTVGALGRSDVGPSMGFLGGAVLGGAAGYLLGKDCTLDHSVLVSTAIGLGLWAGVGAGYGILGPLADSRYIKSFAVGGEVVGLALSPLIWKATRSWLESPGPAGGAEGTLLPGAGILGGAALHLVGQLSRQDDVAAYGMLSGVLLGAGVGSLVGRHLSSEHGALLSTGAAWGLGVGALAGVSALGPNPEFRQVELIALLGSALGLSTAELAWSPNLVSGDVMTVNALGATGFLLGTGIVQLPTPKNDIRPATALIAGTTTVGLVAGRLLAPHLRFTPGGTDMVALATLHGMFAGMAVPGLVESDVLGRHRWAGTLLGASLGTLTGGAIAQATDYRANDVSVLFGADLYGSLFGLGSGLLASREDKPTAAPNAGFLLGGALSLAVASRVAKDLAFSTGDLALVALSTLWGSWQGLAIAAGSHANGQQTLGATLLGLGFGGVGGMALSQKLELGPGWVAAAASGALWGVWMSGFSLALAPKVSVENAFLILMGASDGGIILASIFMSPWVGASPTQVGVASLGGIAGAIFGTLGTALVSNNVRALVTANLVGSGIGLVGGAIVAGLIGQAKEPQPHASDDESRRLPAISFQGLSSQPLLSADGRMSGMAVSAVFRND